MLYVALTHYRAFESSVQRKHSSVRRSVKRCEVRDVTCLLVGGTGTLCDLIDSQRNAYVGRYSSKFAACSWFDLVQPRRCKKDEALCVGACVRRNEQAKVDYGAHDRDRLVAETASSLFTESDECALLSEAR